jgi:hypothetical protein
VLEKAGLVIKHRSGKEKVVCIVPATMRAAEARLTEDEKLWAARFDAIDGTTTEIRTLSTAQASFRPPGPRLRRFRGIAAAFANR